MFLSVNAVAVNYNPVVAAITGINRICVGSTATLSNVTPGGVWKSLNNSIATIDQNGLVTGVTMGSASIGYTVTASDNTSNTVFYSLTITAPTSFNCEVGVDSLHFIYLPNCDTTLCEGTKLWLSVNPNGLTPITTWTGPNGFAVTSINSNNDVLITNNITPATAGIYTVTYSIPGCVSTKSINIHTKSVTAVASVTGTTNVCAGSTTQLADSTIGGIWSTSNNAIATVSAAGIVTGVAGGTATISYTYTNVNACSVAQTALVTVSTPVVLTCEGSTGAQYTIGGLTNSTINGCLGQNLWLSVNPNNLTNGSATWTGPNGFSSTSLNSGNDLLVSNALTTAQGGVYIATYTQGVCTSVAKITVVANPVPVVAPITGNNNICMGGGTTQLSDTTAGGVWKSTNTSYATISASGLVTGILSANIYMDYTVTNTAGCSTVQQFLVSINSPFVFTCEGSIDNHNYTTLPNCTYTVCEGNPVWLSVNPNFSSTPGGDWTGPNGFASPSLNGNNDVLISNAVSASQAGVYTITYHGVCTSVGTITLVVKPTPVLDTIAGYATVCKAGMIQLSNTTAGGAWTSSNTNTVTINSGGIVTGVINGNSNITYTVTNASGCTAKVSKLVTVTTSSQTNPLVSGPGNICVGSSANLTTTVPNGVWSSSNTALAGVTNAGVVSVTGAGYVYIMYNLTNTNGCNFTAFKTINTPVKSTSTTNATICAGTTYTFNGSSYNAAGTYTAHLTNAAGCDSAATLVLTIINSSSSITNINSCSSYTWNGTTYNTSGTYIYHATNAAGCDSIATLHLTINTTSSSTTNASACGPYLWNGITYNNRGTYTFNTTNAAGCDSVATLHLTINNGTTSATNASICVGSSYTFNGQTYTTAGTYLAFLTNSVGCDSIATLNLTVNQATSSLSNASICNGLSYTFNGQTYTSAGTYLTFLTNAAGCDSVATLNLTLVQPTISSINISICEGASYSFNGHTYTSSGTYTAHLTNHAGCDSIATLNLSVSSVGHLTVLAIGGTSIVCPGDSTMLSNATSGGIWSIDSTNIATIDSLTGKVKGLVEGSALVTYTIGSEGTACSASVSVPFTVNCSEVGSGTYGGVESKSLGDAIAKRIYNAALSNKDNTIDYSKLSAVNTKGIIQVMGTGSAGNLNMTDLMPAKEAIGCGFKTYDMSSHVSDLTGFTNAEAVQTYDYVVKNETQSVTFVTRTYSNVYAHTKPVCDRLKEAKLLDVKQVSIQGMTFIQYKLQQNDGKIEYAISFSAGVKQNENKFNIQSIWLTRNYHIEDTMYNFQVWAVEPVMAKNMVGSILTKLNAVLPVNQIVDSIGIPSTYITDITRTQNKLIMNIRNNTSSTNGVISLTVRSNENIATTSPMSVPVTLLPNAVTPVTIDVKDSYESDISLMVDNTVKDMVYMNDGNWNYSVSKTSIVPNKFTISNDGIMPTADEFRLFRNVTIDVNVPDYVSIYKMMKAGGLSRDVSGYNQLQFKASATNTGKLTIVLQKASIANWSEQYTYTMPINGDLNDYAINLKDFKSTGSNDTLKADDIVTITFSFIGNGNNNHIIASMADVRFSQKEIIQPIAIAKTMNVFPNPATERFNVRFVSDKNTKLTIQLVEIGSGRLILSKEASAVVGENLIPITLNTTMNADGHYVLLMGNETMRYSPFKIVFRK